MRWIYVLLGLISNAVASALIKFAIMPPKAMLSWTHWDAILLNFPLLIGVLMGVIAWFFYREALRRFPENIMLILVIGSVVIVTLVSWSFMSASLVSTLTLGLVLGIVGLLIMRIGQVAIRRSRHAIKHPFVKHPP